MPDLLHSLQSRDLGHLRIVASLWGVELASVEMDAALTELAATLLDPALVGEIVDALSAEVLSALDALAEEGGRIPWATFVRRFGEIREIGPGRRDREQPYLQPISAAETLFYRALLARAFFDTPNGPQEFAYIPDDLLLLIHHEESFGCSQDKHGEHRENIRKDSVDSLLSVVKNEPLGRPASPKEHAHVIPANDRILDDACTLLAALRMGLTPPETPIPVRVVTEFLSAAKIILSFPRGGGTGGEGKPRSPSRRGAGGEVLQAEATKSFLETPRAEALSMLVEAWKNSETFNELRLMPGLVCEGEWTNSPLVTRHLLIGFLSNIPKNQWWSLPAFVRAVKEKYPDFQRPAGDYDSWFIRRAGSDTYLRGFDHWDDVDGALIRYLISGPLFWLGMVELATPADCEIITAFRPTSHVTRPASLETGKLHISSQGKITIPRSLPQAARYQISRFCEWKEEKPDEYRYRVSTRSLKKAQEQGLKVSQLLSLLAKNAAAEIPPAFVKALKRWERNGTEARIENPVVLRVNRPEVLEELRKSKAGRFLGEILGPTTVIVKKGAQSKVLAALAEMGLLAEDDSMSR
jgi:hypothetical protein